MGRAGEVSASRCGQPCPHQGGEPRAARRVGLKLWSQRDRFHLECKLNGSHSGQAVRSSNTLNIAVCRAGRNIAGMNLDEAQRRKVAEWIEQGLKLSEIQGKLDKDLHVSMTYMEVRFLIDDLKLRPKDPVPPRSRPSRLRPQLRPRMIRRPPRLRRPACR